MASRGDHWMLLPNKVGPWRVLRVAAAKVLRANAAAASTGTPAARSAAWVPTTVALSVAMLVLLCVSGARPSDMRKHQARPLKPPPVCGLRANCHRKASIVSRSTARDNSSRRVPGDGRMPEATILECGLRRHTSVGHT